MLGDAAFGEIESAQENAGLSADRVGDDLFMGEFMIQRRTCDAPVDLEKLGRELDERLDGKPAMALVVMPIFMAIAMPSATAKRRCPHLIFVTPRFDVYKAVSLQIRKIFAEYTATIEPLSLDEAYLDVTENLKGIASPTEIAEDIRAEIRHETYLTASAGVS